MIAAPGAKPTSANASSSGQVAGAGSSDVAGAVLAAVFGERRQEREAFVERTIARMGVTDERVLAAMRKVPRHRFVPRQSTSEAYCDYPLPIGFGQTISQPYIVALMTERAEVTRADRCLEIGTGSGYQAAVLAELCAETYSVEYIPALADFARANLESLGYQVHLRAGDGGSGWPEAAPFDAIVVTAAPVTVPKALLLQLALGGRLVIPVGSQRQPQMLELWRRQGPGVTEECFTREELSLVAFVPFLGDAERRK